jgi:hypothetical protein
MCSDAAARSSGSRSAKRIRLSNFACSCWARKVAWYRYCRRPAASTPVACSFALGLGEIQTSFHAGGITSARIRSSFASSAILLPRAST